jgi:hypothetical protein
VGGSLKPQAPQNTSPEMQIEAIELASNFILKTTLHNPRVLSRAETPIAVASHGAAWRSDEALGSSGSVRRWTASKVSMSHPRWSPPTPRIAKENLRPAAPVNWSTATSYSGDFPPVRIPTARAFRNISSSPGKKGGFVLFSVVSNMKTEEAKIVTKEERLVDFRKAALVVVNQ